MADVDWQVRAACRRVDDPNMFSPDLHDVATAAEAVHICVAHCLVRRECAEWAAAYTWTGIVVGGVHWTSQKGKSRRDYRHGPCRRCSR